MCLYSKTCNSDSMRPMKNKKTVAYIVRIIVILLAIAIVLFVLDTFGILNLGLFSNNATFVPYNEFLEQVERSNVVSIEIFDDYVEFETSFGKFKTSNPSYDSFVKDMLENGVTVKDERQDSSALNSVLDTVFNILFIGLIAFGAIKLIQYSKKTFRVVKHTGVSFNDIAGMDNLKKDMAFLVDVLKNPSTYSTKGVRPVKGVILEGPPGNGKTLFAKALAQEANVRFIATKGADFQSAFMSMGARKIRMLFSKANRNKPCIVFIDEFDSIGERRNYAGTGIDKENNRIITAMLNEMDGFTVNNGLLVIAATNSFASLDPALVRPGRFDLKYHIENPNYAARKRLIEIYTKGRSLSSDLDIDALALSFDGLSCSAIEALLNEASSIALQGHGEDVSANSAIREGATEIITNGNTSKEVAITSHNIIEAASKIGVKITLKAKR